MIVPDVNVLIYAFRDDSQNHSEFRQWLQETLEAEEPYGIFDLVCSGFLRIVTHPKIFPVPTSLEEALIFIDYVRAQPNCFVISPGPRHWSIFRDLCRTSQLSGAIISDAYYAALAIESGSEWITTDRDFNRFPGLRWRRPF